MIKKIMLATVLSMTAVAAQATEQQTYSCRDNLSGFRSEFIVNDGGTLDKFRYGKDGGFNTVVSTHLETVEETVDGNAITQQSFHLQGTDVLIKTHREPDGGYFQLRVVWNEKTKQLTSAAYFHEDKPPLSTRQNTCKLDRTSAPVVQVEFTDDAPSLGKSLWIMFFHPSFGGEQILGAHQKEVQCLGLVETFQQADPTGTVYGADGFRLSCKEARLVNG